VSGLSCVLKKLPHILELADGKVSRAETEPDSESGPDRGGEEVCEASFVDDAR
jgi:hypothetical protein